jgi:hypothetical protein
MQNKRQSEHTIQGGPLSFVFFNSSVSLVRPCMIRIEILILMGLVINVIHY